MVTTGRVQGTSCHSMHRLSAGYIAVLDPITLQSFTPSFVAWMHDMQVTQKPCWSLLSAQMAASWRRAAVMLRFVCGIYLPKRLWLPLPVMPTGCCVLLGMWPTSENPSLLNAFLILGLLMANALPLVVWIKMSAYGIRKPAKPLANLSNGSMNHEEGYRPCASTEPIP